MALDTGKVIVLSKHVDLTAKESGLMFANLDVGTRAAILLETARAVERVYMLDDGVPNWPDACQRTANHLTPDEAGFILRIFGPLVQQLGMVAFPRKNAEADQTTD